MQASLLCNPDLARLVADLTGDGHLQINGHRHIASFYSKDLDEIKEVKKRFYDLFQIKGKIHEDNRPVGKTQKPVKRYKIFFISKPVAIFLKDIGTPVGDKTNVPFLVPKWIIKGHSTLKKAYLQGLYDAEGSIFVANKRWQIALKMAKNEIGRAHV